MATSKHHPIADAYDLYRGRKNPQPTYDLTSVLYAVRPDRGYFDLSPPGRVTVEDDGFVRFQPEANGPHRYLIATPEQVVRSAGSARDADQSAAILMMLSHVGAWW